MSGLAERGQRLWDAAKAAKPDLSVADEVVLEEACRLTDRLDRLASLLDGDEAAWCRVEVPERGEAEIVIDQALSAARLHAATLTGLLKSLGLPDGVAVPGTKESDDPLAARRADRSKRRTGAAS